MSKPMKNCFVGAVSGLLATVPMTIVLIVGKRLFPEKNRTPLPPVQITQNALHTVGASDLSSQKQAAFATLNHFGFGTGTGALYGSCCQIHTVMGAVTAGGIYGLGVWTCSYLGWLPASGLHRNAVKETSQRNSLMITAHLVWGVSVGLGTYFFSKRSADDSPTGHTGIDPDKRTPGRWSPGDQNES